MHGSPASCTSTEFISVTAESGFMLVHIFIPSIKHWAQGVTANSSRAGGLQEDTTALHRNHQRALSSSPQRTWGRLGALVPENREPQPERHRNQDLPSSQDVKPSKEAETSQRERQGPSGNTDHSHTHKGHLSSYGCLLTTESPREFTKIKKEASKECKTFLGPGAGCPPACGLDMKK